MSLELRKEVQSEYAHVETQGHMSEIYNKERGGGPQCVSAERSKEKGWKDAHIHADARETRRRHQRRGRSNRK